MEYSVQNLSETKIEISIDLTKEEWEALVAKIYNKTKFKYSIQGFRSGKAPRAFIEKAYGKGVFYNDAIELAVDQYYGEIVEKDKLALIKTIDLDVREMSEDGAKFTVTAIIEPKFELGQYKGLTVKKQDTTVTDEEIDAYIKREQENRARLVTVDAPAENGNTAVIDFVGSVDGVPFDGGAGESYELELGSKTFIPGFEDQVVGMKAGETKDVVVTFPEEYQSKELAGKEAVFKVTLHAVKVKEYPEIDDEFAKDMDENIESLEQWKGKIREEIGQNKEERAEAEIQNDLIKLIADGTEIVLPDIQIEEEADRLVNQMAEEMKYYKLDMDSYLKYSNLTLEDVKNQKKEQATQYVKERYVLTKLIEQENITVEQEEFKVEMAKLGEAAQKSEEMFTRVYNNLLIDKVFKFLKENNNIE